MLGIEPCQLFGEIDGIRGDKMDLTLAVNQGEIILGVHPLVKDHSKLSVTLGKSHDDPKELVDYPMEELGMV